MRGKIGEEGGRNVIHERCCFLSNFLPSSLPFRHPPPSNELSVSHILNLPSKHGGMIGAVSQINVLFATEGTGRKTVKERKKNYNIEEYTYSVSIYEMANDNFDRKYKAT